MRTLFVFLLASGLSGICLAQRPVAGFIPHIPDTALYPLIAIESNVPLGNLVKGRAITRWKAPVSGIWVFDTLTAEMVQTDSNGLFCFWKQEKISEHCLKVREYTEFNNIRIFLQHDSITLTAHYADPCFEPILHSKEITTLGTLLEKWEQHVQAFRCPLSKGYYWHVSLVQGDQQADGILISSIPTPASTSFPNIQRQQRWGIYQAWGDSVIWRQYLREVCESAAWAEAQTSSPPAVLFPCLRESGLMENMYMLYPETGTDLTFTDSSASYFRTDSSLRFSLRERFFINVYDYHLDRHDLVLRYPPKEDLIRHERCQRTDSISWHYHQVGAYNQPSLFSFTAQNTWFDANGNPFCIDTLQATFSLLYISPGSAIPEEQQRQMVPLSDLPTSFPPDSQSFATKYLKIRESTPSHRSP